MKGFQGLKEIAKGLKLVDPKSIIDAGRRGYSLGIEFRDNPRRTDRERKLWEEGWKLEEQKFRAMLARNGGNLH
jgi:hypothetical protein